MRRVLADRLRRLVRGEDGVAVMTTLAVFMFMYLVVIGVYAVGTAVRERIYLQNACDAAAYSASVVQADALSRIATINRAMSWTYVQMTRREMDYIVNTWLRHVVEHYEDDQGRVNSWWNSGTRCEAHGGHIVSQIFLNGRIFLLKDVVKLMNSLFPAHVAGQPGMYASKSLGAQILADRLTIRQMNAAIDDLAANLPRHVEKTAESILKANVQDSFRKECRWFLEQNENVASGRENASGGTGYLRDLHSNATDENHFLAFSGYDKGVKETFRTGIDKWYVYGNGDSATDGAVGFQRSYRHWKKDVLWATWSWWSTKTVCHGIFHFAGIPYMGGCPHHCADGSCRCTVLEIPSLDPLFVYYTYRAKRKIPKIIYNTKKIYADLDGLWNENFYVGEKARPLVLRKEFFGERGAISVGLARHNDNPWFSVLGNVTKGVFTAFNPFSEWTWCFASARAGYKFLGEDSAGRDYRMDWKTGAWTSENQSWNLCQSDWDGALIPVRRAKSQAAGGAWADGDTTFLSGWVDGSWRWLESGNNPSIGSWDAMLAGGGGSASDVAVQPWDELKGGTAPNREWNVRRKWLVGHPNQKIDWGKLTQVMFH